MPSFGREPDRISGEARQEERFPQPVPTNDSSRDPQQLIAGLTRLHTVSLALAGAPSVLAVAEIMVTQGVEALGADAGLVALLDADQTQLSILDARGYDPTILATRSQIALSQPSALTEAVITRTPIWLGTITEQLRAYPHMLILPLSSRFQARAALPLLVGDQVLGVLQFNFIAGRSFDATERQVLEALAALGAQALDRAQLYDQQQRSLLRLKTLQSMDQGMLKGKPAAEIITQALDDMSTFIPYQFAVVSLVNTRRGLVRVVSHRDRRHTTGTPTPPLDPAAIPGDLASEQVRYTPDLAAIDASTDYDALLLANGLRGLLSVPLVVEQVRIGQIDVLTEQPSAFSNDDQQVVSEIANQIAVVLHHKQLLLARTRAQERWHHIVETSPYGMVMVNAAGRIALVNGEIERLFGYTRTELIGAFVERIIPVGFHAAHETYHQRFAPEVVGRTSETKHDLYGQRKDGSTFPIEIRLNPFPTNEGFYTLVAMFDMTEHKRAAAAVQESEQKLSALVKLLPVGISILNDNREIVYTNLAMERILDLPIDKLVEGAYRQRRYIRSDGTPMPSDEFASARAVAEQRAVYGVETGIVKHDGQISWVSVNAAPVDLPNWRVVVVTSDITERKQAEEALRMSEERFRRYFELGLVGMAVASPHQYFLDVNNELCAMLGYHRDELLQIKWSDLTHPDDLPADMVLFAQVMAGASDGFARDKRYIRKDGQVIHALVSVKCLRHSDASVASLLVLIQNITERKQAEGELRDREEHLRILTEAMPAVPWAATAQGQIDYFNQRWLTLTGLTADQALGDGWQHIIHPEDLPVVAAAWLHSLATGAPYDVIHRVRTADGSYRWQRSRALPQRDEHDAIVRWYGITDDIHELREAEAALRQYADELQRLSQRTVEVQELERHSIARELHDQIGQSLTGLKLLFASARTIRDEALQQHLDEASRVINELLGRVRNLSLDLRPSMLDDLGLLPALKWLIERYTLQTGVQVGWWHQGLDRRFPANVEISVYRVIQEALTNTARHANVNLVEVRVMADDEQLLVQIDDEGNGFDVHERRRTGHSLGLLGMHERAALLGGTLLIESQPGQGTHLSMTFPIYQKPVLGGDA